MDEFKKYADKAKADGNGALFRRIMMERRIAFKIVELALADGHTVSVSDGEEFTVKRSRDKEALRAALFTTDEDLIVVRNAAGDKLGWFQMIYGNDGYDVVSDYSANDYSESLYKRMEPMIDKMEMVA